MLWSEVPRPTQPEKPIPPPPTPSKKEVDRSTHLPRLLALTCLPLIASRQQYAYTAGALALGTVGGFYVCKTIQLTNRGENHAAWWRAAEAILYLSGAITFWLHANDEVELQEEVSDTMITLLERLEEIDPQIEWNDPKELPAPGDIS